MEDDAEAGAEEIVRSKDELAGGHSELELHRKALCGTPHGICLFDCEDRLIFCNGNYEAILGLSTENVKPGVTLEQLVQHGAATAGGLKTEMLGKLKNGQPVLLSRADKTYTVSYSTAGDGYRVATFEDTTEQHAAMEELRASEERYRNTIELNKQIAWTLDPEGAPLSISKHWRQLTGCSPEAAEAGEWWSFIHPEDAKSIQKELLDALGTGQRLETRARFRTRDGSYRWFRTRAAPKRNKDEQIVRWYGTCEDIHEQIQAEQRLLESEERLRAITDALPDCVKIFDEAGAILHINPAGLDLLQAEKIEDLSAPGYSPVPPEHMDLCLATHQKVLSGQSAVWNYEIVGLAGRRRHVEAHSVPFQLTDGSKAHLCISRDSTERREAENSLRESEELLRMVQETTGLTYTETIGNRVKCSPSYLQQVGLPPQDAISTEECLELVHPEDRARIRAEVMRGIAEEDVFDCECRIIRPDNGETRWLSTRSKIERDEEGEVARIIGAHRDITERKRSEAAVRESEERFRLAAEAAGLGVSDYDIASDREEWSNRLREILGISEGQEPTLKLAMTCVCPSHRSRLVGALEHLRDSEEQDRFETTVPIRRADDGVDRWILLNAWRADSSKRQAGRIIMTIRDITEEKTAEERIRWSANHDALTGLANRALFQESLDGAIREAGKRDTAVGLLLLDLDHFKQINDGLGHHAGDELLKMIAERLRNSVRSHDIVARLGGDEFAILFPRLPSEEVLKQLTQSLLEQMQKPFLYGGRVLDVRASIGGSAFPSRGKTAEELLKNADMALYAAKSAGRATSALFEPHMRDEVQRRSLMIQRARDAIDGERIVPHYQPKLDLVSGSIVGFEALLRWKDDEGRIQPPNTVEAAFEDLEAATAISNRMIARVVADMRDWLDRGVPFGHVAVNAAAAEFRRGDFAECLLEQLTDADVPTKHFQLEVTETVFLGRGAQNVHRALALLSSQGVKVALDDFGTGYASLRHLKQFPVDIIKIDKGFVRDMHNKAGDDAIVKAVINLGRSLGIKVVAEGIETQDHVERLVQLGCDFGQGFLFSKAVDASQVPAMVNSPSPNRSSREPPSEALRLVSSRD